MAEKLKRTLSLAECIFFGVGSILGAGIYTIIGKVAGYAGNLTWLSFLIASFTALLTAFSYAELSAAYPKAGGEYVYTKKAMGVKAGTAIGFIIALNGIISGATVAVGFGGYLGELLDAPIVLGALGIIGVIFLVNVSGIRESSLINIIFTVIEFSGLVLVIVSAFSKIGSVNLFEGTNSGNTSVLIAASLGFFAFIGFEEIVKLAEETKNPRKTIPIALFIASGIV
ncbi:MAG TPA: amino acid permease, partial [Daejeonella sp.]